MTPAGNIIKLALPDDLSDDDIPETGRQKISDILEAARARKASALHNLAAPKPTPAHLAPKEPNVARLKSWARSMWEYLEWHSVPVQGWPRGGGEYRSRAFVEHTNDAHTLQELIDALKALDTCEVCR